MCGQEKANSLIAAAREDVLLVRTRQSGVGLSICRAAAYLCGPIVLVARLGPIEIDGMTLTLRSRHGDCTIIEDLGDQCSQERNQFHQREADDVDYTNFIAARIQFVS